MVDESMLKELESMGFPSARGIRALHFSGNSSVEGAINWLEAHEADADLDEPLLVKKVGAWGMMHRTWGMMHRTWGVIVYMSRHGSLGLRGEAECVSAIKEPDFPPLQESNKPKLSPEEARKKAEEMIRLAKAQREKEEKEQEVRYVRDGCLPV